MARASVVIIGGGVAGLSAAWELSSAVAPGTRIEIIEAAPIVGGALACRDFAGHIIDLGPDGFLARRPEATQLIDELGLRDELEAIDASGAWIFLAGRLNKLPEGLVLGVPTSASSLRGLRGLSWHARLAAWRDEHLPRTLEVGDDETIGAIIRAKLGDELALNLIEPMIGGIQAGRIDDLSAAAVFPALLEAARRGGSLMRAIAPTGPVNPGPVAPTVAGPAFCTLRGGVGSLPVALARRLQERGVIISTGTTATALRRSRTGHYAWEVDTATTTTPANAVVVAVGPEPTGRLLASFDPLFERIGDIPTASNAIVTYVVARGEVTLPEGGTGVLVPLATPFAANDSMIVTAVTFLDRKWPHLRANDTCLVRAHVGRSDDQRGIELDDHALVARVSAELSRIFGGWPSAADSIVARWYDGLPQYLPGHLELVAAARECASHLNLALAGNTYDGVGIPASIGSGRRAARSLLSQLASGTRDIPAGQ